MELRIQCLCIDATDPARIASPDELPPGHDALGRRITASDRA